MAAAPCVTYAIQYDNSNNKIIGNLVLFLFEKQKHKYCKCLETNAKVSIVWVTIGWPYLQMAM